MNCTEVASRLQLFIDEELIFQDMESIRKHLQVCPDCEKRFQTEKLFKQTLKDKIMKRNIESHVVDGVKDFIHNSSN